MENHRRQTDLARDPSYEYKSFKDGCHFQQNTFLNNDELQISICLYDDDFEACNAPRHLLKKAQALCCLLDTLKPTVPPGSHSSLSSIYRAVLCKSDDLEMLCCIRCFEVEDKKGTCRTCE